MATILVLCFIFGDLLGSQRVAAATTRSRLHPFTRARHVRPTKIAP